MYGGCFRASGPPVFLEQRRTGHAARQEETDVLMMPSCTLRAVLKTTSMQINVILGPPLDERIVIF